MVAPPRPWPNPRNPVSFSWSRLGSSRQQQYSMDATLVLFIKRLASCICNDAMENLILDFMTFLRRNVWNTQNVENDSQVQERPDQALSNFEASVQTKSVARYERDTGFLKR
jgi:hypothetical protein